MMRQTNKLILAALAVFVAGALATAGGCGDDGFDERDQGQLSLDSSGELLLEVSSDRPTTQSEIQFDNTGNGDLTFSSFELVDVPDRLTAIQSAGDQPTTCTYESDNPPMYGTGCDTGQVCWFLTNQCRPLGFPDAPIVIAPDRSLTLNMVVMPGDEQIECVDPPADDENAPPNYCGKLVVETDASNDADFISDGNATIYFQYAPGSGQINVTPTQIDFGDAEPGGSYSADFTVANEDPEDTLTINGVSINEQPNLFEVTGDEDIEGAEISPQAAKSWTVNFNPPEGTNIDELDGIFLTVESSDRGATNNKIFLSIGGGGNTPVVTVEPSLLTFDSSTEQTVTVTNVEGTNGEDRPNIRLRSLTTADNDDYYTFLIDGTEIDGNIDTDLIQPGSSKEITVRYAKPDGATDAGATEARLNYSYFEGSTGDTPIRVTKRFGLLGDQASAPLGRIAPMSLLFRAADGNEKTHPFVIRNLGNASLDLSGAALGDPALGTKDEFSFDVPTSVAAGEIAQGSVTYSGTNSENDNVALEMNSNTAGAAMNLNLFADGGAPEATLDAVITPFGGDTVSVGSKVVLNAQQSTVPDPSILDSAEWFLLSRPAGSTAFVNENGENVAFFPDVAGDYTVGMIVYEGAVGASTTYTFTAE